MISVSKHSFEQLVFKSLEMKGSVEFLQTSLL